MELDALLLMLGSWGLALGILSFCIVMLFKHREESSGSLAARDSGRGRNRRR